MNSRKPQVLTGDRKSFDNAKDLAYDIINIVNDGKVALSSIKTIDDEIKKLHVTQQMAEACQQIMERHYNSNVICEEVGNGGYLEINLKEKLGEVFKVLRAQHSIKHQCATKELSNLLSGASGEVIVPGI